MLVSLYGSLSLPEEGAESLLESPDSMDFLDLVFRIERAAKIYGPPSPPIAF